jgi:hypothetical protein
LRHDDIDHQQDWKAFCANPARLGSILGLDQLKPSSSSASRINERTIGSSSTIKIQASLLVHDWFTDYSN